MEAKEIVNLVKSGRFPTVTFTDVVLGQETCIDPGMRGRLIKVNLEDPDCVIFTFDIEEFADFNRPLERSDYFDQHGKATLTAREAGCYVAKEEVYGPSSGDVTEFVIESDRVNALIAQHVSEGSGKTYVQWLEDMVLSGTAFGKAISETFP